MDDLSSLMIGRSPSLFPSKGLIHPTCGRNQLGSFTSFSFTRGYSHASSTKLGLSLASLLGIVVAAGCSWYRLNLDASSSTRDDAPNVRQQPVYDDDSTGSGRMHYPRAYVQTSEKTVFPGDHTGVARFDMAHSHSTSCVLLPL
jgi:hypothetical protein